MPTNLTRNVPYQLTDVWSICHRGSMPKQRKFILKLFGRLKKYQAAKQRLFEPDSKGNLPLVTKELAQDVCKKYDAVLCYYRSYARDLTKTPLNVFYYSSLGTFSVCCPFRQAIDDAIEVLQKQDNESVEWMREHFRERSGYIPKVANIHEIGDFMVDLSCVYPFHTSEEIERAEAQLGKSKNLPKKNLYKRHYKGIGKDVDPENTNTQKILEISFDKNEPAASPEKTKDPQNAEINAPGRKQQDSADVRTKKDNDECITKKLLDMLRNGKTLSKAGVNRPRAIGTTRLVANVEQNSVRSRYCT